VNAEQPMTALVTGGSRGIGLAVAKRLASGGTRVALCARDEDNLIRAAEDVSGSTGQKVEIVAADLSSAAGTDAAVQEAGQKLGQVDVLVNVAGSAPAGTIDRLTDEQWDVALDLKLRGYIRLMRAVLPAMIERRFGRIVNIAGNAGKQPEGWLVTSGVVNAAVLALTKAVATSIAETGVTVNAVCPGPTETTRWAGMQKAYAELNGVSEDEARDRILAHIPAGRIATPEEVAYGVAFFAAREAGHITGEALMIDGGHVRGL